jgi:hypothetical protein
MNNILKELHVHNIMYLGLYAEAKVSKSETHNNSLRRLYDIKIFASELGLSKINAALEILFEEELDKDELITIFDQYRVDLKRLTRSIKSIDTEIESRDTEIVTDLRSLVL